MHASNGVRRHRLIITGEYSYSMSLRVIPNSGMALNCCIHGRNVRAGTTGIVMMRSRRDECMLLVSVKIRLDLLPVLPVLVSKPPNERARAYHV